MALTFSVFLHSSNSLSWISYQFGVGAYLMLLALCVGSLACTRCCRIFVLPWKIFREYRSGLVWESPPVCGACSSRHLHASKWFTHLFVDFVLFLLKVFSLNFCKSPEVAAPKMGRGSFQCCASFAISAMNASASSISSSSSVPVGSLKNWGMLSLKKSSSPVPAIFFACNYTKYRKLGKVQC